MRNSSLASGLALLFCASSASAVTSVSGTVTVQCSGDKAGAQVALRWGTPSYDSTSASPQFKLACSTSGPMSTKSMPFTLNGPKSQIEVQTEGGIPTTYNLNFDMGSGVAGKRNKFQLNHSGSPTSSSTNNGFTLNRSSGPNKYGEQNFRIFLSKPSAPVHVEVKSNGDRSDAQVALRWGHPDFNNNNDFGLWTVHLSDGLQHKDFLLTAPRSEFEIQTEGGTGTGYDIKIWFSQAANYAMTMPDVVINHVKPATDHTTETEDASFSIPDGTIYGEMTIGISAPWVMTPVPPTATTGGLNLRYDYGPQDPTLPNSTVSTEFNGQYVVGTGTPVSGARTRIGPFDVATVVSGSGGVAIDPETGLQPGSWQIFAGQRGGATTSCNIVVGAGTAPYLYMSAPTNQLNGCRQ